MVVATAMLILGEKVTPMVILGTCPFIKTTRTIAIFTCYLLLSNNTEKKGTISVLQTTEINWQSSMGNCVGYFHSKAHVCH